VFETVTLDVSPEYGQAVARRLMAWADVLIGESAVLASTDMGATVRKALGRMWRTGPALGADNERVYLGYLGMVGSEYETLQRSGTT
jgi:hypothetical protein